MIVSKKLVNMVTAMLLTGLLICNFGSYGDGVYGETTDGAVTQPEDQYVVVINPGHQAKGNFKKEPRAPGSKIRKYKVTSGARGIATRTGEYKRNLQVAKRLKKDLEAKGVKVYLTRTKNDVNISNSQRAKFANKKKADLMISLHCDACGKSSVKGITMLVPQKNKYTKKHYSKSLKAGKTVLKQVIKTTKAKNRGISKRKDITGFNYSEIPTILIEMGFMTNRTEDRKMATASYQKKLSKGMANGIMKYLEGQ